MIYYIIAIYSVETAMLRTTNNLKKHRFFKSNSLFLSKFMIFSELNSCEQQHLRIYSHLSFWVFFSPDPKGLSSSPEPVRFTRLSLSYNIQTVLAHLLVNLEHQSHRSKSHTVTDESSNQCCFHTCAPKHHIVRHLAFFVNLAHNGSDSWFFT